MPDDLMTALKVVTQASVHGIGAVQFQPAACNLRSSVGRRTRRGMRDRTIGSLEYLREVSVAKAALAVEATVHSLSLSGNLGRESGDENPWQKQD